MFDIGWPEMAVVAVIALIIIGPKDLPRILRYAGRWAGKARRMAREFQRNFDDMVRESELDEVKKSVEQVSGFNPVKDIKNTIDPSGEIQADIESLTRDEDEPSKPDAPEADDAAKPAAPEADEAAKTDAPSADDTPKTQASA